MPHPPVSGRDGCPAVTESAWWHPWADVIPSWFTTYLMLEHTASRISTYEAQFVPGLFQTADYARAVISLAHSDPDEIERRVALRQARQRHLDTAEAPEVCAVLDDAAPTRPALTPGQTRAQLDMLLELTERPNITIRIVSPKRAGRAVGESFTILRDVAQSEIVYVEAPDSARYLQEPADIARYSAIMDRLCTPAEAVEQTRAAILTIRESM